MNPNSATGRGLRADAARNRIVLLDAAREAFAQHGVGASLDDVARAAGVGPGTLYRHFPSRDDLVMAVIEDGLAEIHNLGVAQLNDPDPLGALRCWLDAFIAQGSMFDGLARTLANPPPATRGDTVCAQARDAGGALIVRAARAGLIRSDTNADDVLDMAAAIAWVGGQPGRHDSQRGRLLDVVIAGLRPGE